MTSISTLTSANATENDKSSMIQAYGTTMKRAIDYMKEICIETKEFEQLENVKNFETLFKMEPRGPLQYVADAIEARGQTVNRAHKNEVNPKDVARVREYMYNTLDNDIFTDRHEFIKTRDVFMTFLTMLNARRGGEVSKLSLEEARRGLDGHHLPRNYDIFTPQEENILANHTIVFVPGKVRSLFVNVVFANKYRYVLGLIDEDNRARAGVMGKNTMVFATTCAEGALQA